MVNTSVLVIFWYLNISWRQNWSIYSWIVKHLTIIACIRTCQRFIQGPSNINDETLAKIVSNVNLELLTILSKKVQLRCLTGFRLCFCRWIQYSSKNSNGYISLTATKDRIVIINYIHLKFRSVNCLGISQTSKTTIKSICLVLFSRIFVRNIFWQLLSKHPRWSLFLVNFFLSAYSYGHVYRSVWSMKFNLWEESYFRHSNIHTTKASLQRFLTEIL